METEDVWISTRVMYYVDNYSILVVTLLLLVYIAEILQINTRCWPLHRNTHHLFLFPSSYIYQFIFIPNYIEMTQSDHLTKIHQSCYFLATPTSWQTWHMSASLTDRYWHLPFWMAKLALFLVVFILWKSTTFHFFLLISVLFWIIFVRLSFQSFFDVSM